jgi:hypothetical protein
VQSGNLFDIKLFTLLGLKQLAKKQNQNFSSELEGKTRSFYLAFLPALMSREFLKINGAHR